MVSLITLLLLYLITGLMMNAILLEDDFGILMLLFWPVFIFIIIVIDTGHLFTRFIKYIRKILKI